MKIHKRQSSNCLMIQNLNENETLIILKIEMSTTLIYFKKLKTKKIAIVIQKTIEQKIDVIVNFKFRTKIKTKIKFFKSYKFEKFTINFNLMSTSIKFRFEFVKISINI